ncbi:MAG: holo-ACP synthase [Magnetovibrio sp.]|nr:holo-ACP synthase [Magnetovibrio sp.]|tara:strand:+ start:118 stop:537 length:420 start_codon:yes stop_codon:yes gene_type:complete
MILGIGTDVCDIRRIEKTLARFGIRFIDRIFTNTEQSKANQRKKPAYSYAQSFAAKEAFAKALGTGFRQGVFWRDIAVHNHSSGQPYLKITGGAMAKLKERIPVGMQSAIHITQTDEYPIANAVVIIEALPILLEARHP